MTLQLHRPDGRGGLERRPVADGDWRQQLRSPRWRVPRLANTEMNPTSTGVSVLFWIALAGLTFVLLLAGYGSGFWH
ncbi:MAG TPA: hypothetical protein VF763_07250 [Candidatus Limnocylindrales bacterium]